MNFVVFFDSIENKRFPTCKSPTGIEDERSKIELLNSLLILLIENIADDDRLWLTDFLEELIHSRWWNDHRTIQQSFPVPDTIRI